MFKCPNLQYYLTGFTVEIFDETVRIKVIKEIHDRIISATARFYDTEIITKDRLIKHSGEVELFE